MKPARPARSLIASVLILFTISSPVAAEDAPAAADASATAATPPPAAAEPAKAAEPAPTVQVTAITETVEVTRPELKPPRGWSVVMRGKTVYWCSETSNLGSRVRTERQCVTPEGYKEMVWNARRTMDDAANSTIPPR